MTQKMARRKTNEEWVSEVEGLVGAEYTFIEDYVNSSTKIAVKHNDCEHVYKVKPNVFQQGRRCPSCATRNRKGKVTEKLEYSDWKQRVEEDTEEEYLLVSLERDTTRRTVLEVTHTTCNRTYEVLGGDFHRGSRCIDCTHDRTTKGQTKTQKEFEAEVNKLAGEKYIFLEKYVNTYTPIKVKHVVCGNEYKTAPRDFIKGRRCRKCFMNSIRKTAEEFEEEVTNLVGDEYTIMEEYNLSREHVTMRHNVCGNKYKVTPSNFKSGTRCPRCSYSHGEWDVAKYLDTEGIKYEAQKTFKGLINIKPLVYDFYLPELGILIEYQGVQHYKPIEFFGGEDGYKSQKERDSIKKEFAHQNNILLVEVPYTKRGYKEIAEYLGKIEYA